MAKKTYIINETSYFVDEDSRLQKCEDNVYDVCFGKECAIEHLEFLATNNFCASYQRLPELLDKSLMRVCMYDEDGYFTILQATEIQDARTAYQKCHDILCDISRGKVVHNDNGNIDCFF